MRTVTKNAVLTLVVPVVLFAIAGTALSKAELTGTMSVSDVTGELRVTTPDGKTITLTAKNVPARIPFGSTFNLIKGTARINVRCLVPGREVAATVTMSAGSSMRVSFDDKTGEIFVRGIKGTVNVVARNILARVESGEELVIRKDPSSERYNLTALRGDIDLISDGKKSTLAAGASTSTGVAPPVESEPSEPEPIEGSPFMPE